MFLEKISHQNLQDTQKALEEAVSSNGFGIVQILNLKQSMHKKGVELGKEIIIYEVCDPHEAKKVLEENSKTANFLPCKIVLSKEAEGIRLTSLQPTQIFAFFNDPNLQKIAFGIEKTLKKILEETVSVGASR